MENGFILLALYGLLVGLANFGIVITQNTMMIGMSQLVQDHPGLAESPLEKILGIGYLNAACLLGVEAVVAQPLFAGMVAHTSMPRGLILDPHRYSAQLF